MQSEILIQRLLQSAEGGDLAGRDVIWRALLALIYDNPIFGVGKTGYAYFTQINFGGLTSPHNVLLEVVCYTGLFGLILYLTFLFRIGKSAFINFKVSGMLLPCLLLIPVAGFILSGQLLGVKIGWVIFAYVAGNSALENTNLY